MAANDLIKVVFNDFGAGTAETPIISVGKINPRQLILKHAPLNANDYKIYIKRDMDSAYEFAPIITSNTAGAVKKVYNFPTGLTYTFLQFKLVTANGVTVEEPELVFIYQTCDLESQAKRSDLPLVTVNLSGLITPVNVASGFNPMGTYAAGTDYVVGDLVDYNGSSYLMYVDAPAGTLPTDTTKWQKLASVGAQGNGITDNAVGFEYTGGTVPKTLTIPDDAIVYGSNTGDENVSVGFSNATYICDGTDDDVQIQAAIDYVNSLGGGTVLVKIGTFDINTNPIIIKSGVFLKGSGVGITILKRNATSAITLPIQTDTSADITNFGFSDCTIDQNEATPIATHYALWLGQHDTLLSGFTTTFMWLKNLHFKNVSKSGIYAFNVSQFWAENIKIDSADIVSNSDGFNLKYSNNVYLKNLDFKTGDDGLVIRGSYTVEIDGVTRDGAADGAALRFTNDTSVGNHDINATNITETNGTTNTMGSCAVSFSSQSTVNVTAQVDNINVSNIICNDSSYGIFFTTGDTGLQDGITFPFKNITISNFTFKNVLKGIRLFRTSGYLVENLKISNGIIDGSTDEGININSASNLTLENIRMLNGATTGIYIHCIQTAVNNYINNLKLKNVSSDKNASMGLRINITGTDPEIYQPDIYIEDCAFSNNITHGLYSLNAQVTIINSKSKNNGGNGFQIANAGSLYESFLVNLRAENNGDYGISVDASNLTNVVLPYLNGNTLGVNFAQRFSQTPRTLTDYITPGISKITPLLSMADNATFNFPNAVSGFGTIIVGDNEEYAQFRFTVSGVVTLLNNTAGIVNTDTNGKFCIFDNGANVEIKNHLGVSKTVKFDAVYSP